MDKMLEALKGLPEDVQKQAKACKTQQELIELLKANGVEIPGENGRIELSDEDLDMVSGGCWESSGTYDGYGESDFEEGA